MPAPVLAHALPRQARCRTVAISAQGGSAGAPMAAVAADVAERHSAWLAEWHADPILPSAAESSAISGVGAELPWRELHLAIRKWVRRFWAGRPVEGDYEVLLAMAREGWERGLVELVQGQLLVSRRLVGALEHLHAGFERLADYLRPRDYFTVLRRHELLSRLYLSPQAASARRLEDLLLEAGVIRRLEGQPRVPGRCMRHQDLAG